MHSDSFRRNGQAATSTEAIHRPDGARKGPPKPWSLKGIDEATVQLCKLAAQGRGMKINRWVADALQHAAQGQLSNDAPFDAAGRREETNDISQRLARLEGEVDALVKTQAVFLSALASTRT